MNFDFPSLKKNNIQLVEQSVAIQDQILFGLAYTPDGKRLLIQSKRGDERLSNYDGEHISDGDQIFVIAQLTSHNAAELRTRLPWLNPITLGLKTSAGMGDRLGLATPGHVRAIRKMNGEISPIFSQQSIRENTRTGRTPQQVIDDAMWGVFQENWQDGYGADADHLKTTDDIDVCLKAGYSFFTVDPGEFVDNRAENADLSNLRNYAKDLPYELNMEHSGLLNQIITAEHLSITLDEKTLLKSMVKYGRAVWHVYQMYQHLIKNAGMRKVEFEVSVDETDNPTSHAEHVYIASELRRLGVKWISLAPRFVGRFEKGVDYIGDLAKFEDDIRGHAAIAREFGPYKISLHSGSDKFSIYPIAAKATQGLVHLKTAGTSYLEALRTIAEINPTFFNEIYTFCKNHYEVDKLSYHVSAQIDKAPDLSKISDFSEIFDNFDAREILHVTFGSVLKEKSSDGSLRFYEELMRILLNHPGDYARNLEKHFYRHLIPFIQK